MLLRTQQRELVARFFEAVQAGDVARLQEYLAADAAFTADGGGKVPAALRPVHGADAVARLMIGLYRLAEAAGPEPGAWTTRLASINGEPALVADLHGRLDTVFVCSTNADRITAIRAIRNPEKLTWLRAHDPATSS